jgi:hypothetical protein
MIELKEWQMETVNWFNPFASHEEDAQPIGITSNQYEKRTDYDFQILRVMPPKDFLQLVDPLFTPADHGRDSYEWILEHMQAGDLFAPLQVWLTPEEYAFFPLDPWWSERARILRRKPDSIHSLTREERETVVRPHEGRHRATAAIALGETGVPVTVWIKYKDYLP